MFLEVKRQGVERGQTQVGCFLVKAVTQVGLTTQTAPFSLAPWSPEFIYIHTHSLKESLLEPACGGTIHAGLWTFPSALTYTREGCVMNFLQLISVALGIFPEAKLNLGDIQDYLKEWFLSFLGSQIPLCMWWKQWTLLRKKCTNTKFSNNFNLSYYLLKFQRLQVKEPLFKYSCYKN